MRGSQGSPVSIVEQECLTRMEATLRSSALRILLLVPFLAMPRKNPRYTVLESEIIYISCRPYCALSEILFLKGMVTDNFTSINALLTLLGLGSEK